MENIFTQISKFLLLYGTQLIISLIVFIGILLIINFLIKIPIIIINLIAKKVKFLWKLVDFIRYKNEFKQYLKDKQNEN